jgi:MFS family permease
MTGFLIYLFPALMDMILSAVLFMSTVSAAQKGLSAGTVANLITTWAVVYMTMSLLIGRVVAPHNAAKLIIFSCAMSVALSVSFASNSSIRALYTLVALEGIAMAAFFVPFQVFMKSVGEGRRKTINHSVGLYTFSWSMGYAMGPFLAGLLWQRVGWQGTHLIYAAAAVLVGAMTFVLKHAAHPAGPGSQAIPDVAATARPAADYSRMPDLAWMGWVFSGLGCLAIRLVFGLFPSSAETYHLPEFEQGLTLFVLSAVQAAVGLMLGRYHWWMYRPLPILLAGLIGIAGLCLFATAGSTLAFCLAAMCFGIYSGMFFFYLVFHSLVHPDRSARYVSVNEATVGLMSLAGPFLGGMVADNYALRTSYLLTAGMLAVAVGAQAIIHALYLRSKPLASTSVPEPWVPVEAPRTNWRRSVRTDF